MIDIMMVRAGLLTAIVCIAIAYVIYHRRQKEMQERYVSQLGVLRESHMKELQALNERHKLQVEMEQQTNRMRLENVQEINQTLQNRILEIQQQFSESQQQVAALQKENIDLATSNGNYQGQHQELLKILQELQQKNQLVQDLEIQTATLKKEKSLLEEERINWQKEKQQALGEITEGLLAKTDQHSQDIATKLLENVEKISNKVKSLEDDLDKTSAETNRVNELLLHPTGAHNISEITLENILHDAGLQQKYTPEGYGDFLLQAHLTGGNSQDGTEQTRYYPDALVFLPEDRFMIIDSKSSKTFLDVYQQDDADADTQGKVLYLAFKKHLNDLNKKNYRQILSNCLGTQYANRTLNDAQITTCMFLQTDSMLATLQTLCPELLAEAREKRILVVGPTMLIYLLEIASHSIVTQRQRENDQSIRDEVRRLLSNTGNLIESFISFGKRFGGAIEDYNKIAKNLNSHFVNRAKNIAQLGISSPEHSKKIVTIPLLNVIKGNMLEITDTEAEAETETATRPTTLQTSDKNTVNEET